MNISDLFYFIAGYTFFSIMSADKAGDKNKFDIWLASILDCDDICLSFKFEFDNFFNTKILIHIHHWILMFFLFCIAESTNLNKLRWSCIGGLAQGIICYNDFWKVITIC